MSFDIPTPLKKEHGHLHDDLESAIAAGGLTGDAARVVAARLHSHFIREEQFALPPLGLLGTLATSGDRGNISPDDVQRVLAMTDRLSAELPRMLDEHREIVAALQSLTTAAQGEGQTKVVEFAEALIQHAQTEEEVLYPAAILIGRYLKLRSQAE